MAEAIEIEMERIVDSLGEQLGETETELEREYAAKCRLPHKPGMLRLAANPIVLQMLLEERFANRVKILALKFLDNEPSEARFT